MSLQVFDLNKIKEVNNLITIKNNLINKINHDYNKLLKNYKNKCGKIFYVNINPEKK